MKYVKENLEIQSIEISSDYQGGEITKEYKEQVEWLNEKIYGEVFVVSNPKELSACLPFDIEYDSLITDRDREKLLQGQAVSKEGYVEQFDRDIVAVIYPLLDQGNLEGIVYSYLPLNSITEFTSNASYFWMITAIVFLILLTSIGVKLVNKLISPLKEMEVAALKVSQGDYSTVLDETGDNEISRLAKSFNQMSKAMQEEEERIKSFLADISHEIRTPLTYIKGFNQAMLDNIVKTDQERLKYLNLISRETKKLENLVKDLMDIMKYDSDVFQIQFSPIVFAQFIEEMMEKYEYMMKEKNLTLHLDLDPEVIINGDEQRLGQIIENIFENACRYTEFGGSITIRLKSEENTCLLDIEDTGIGIEEKHVVKLTERFYRVNKGRSRFDGGTGLGLSIADRLTKLHGGTMTINSKPNIGTRVRITFPLLEDF
ncbi:MAG: sensor histidine kinase [Bacillus sp. (in: firmicutes)]